MADTTSTGPDNAKRAIGPDRKGGEQHVHIIYVPVELVLNEMHLNALGNGPVGTVALSHVAKHIGQPEPTDIVVFSKQPWHFAGNPGQKELRPHPQVHNTNPETVLVLKPNEEAVWWSEKNFQITRVEASGDPAHPHPGFPEGTTPAPDYPFTNPDPIVTRLEHHNNSDIFVARSGVPKPDARPHMYKISFRIENDNIDPDVYCSN